MASAGDDDVFDRPPAWRWEAVASLGLTGDERIAGLAIGAGYPDVLDPIRGRLERVSGVVCDIGSGLGAATAWLGRTSPARIVAVEPERRAAVLAARSFPELAVVVAAGDHLPLAAGSCDGVCLLGVLSLVAAPDPLVREARRVLRPGGLLALSDLVARGGRLSVPTTGDVFRSPDVVRRLLSDHAFAVEAQQVRPAEQPAEWDGIAAAVAAEIERRRSGSPAYDAWRREQRVLHDLIRDGLLDVATILATSAP